MILFLAGTSDSRAAAAFLKDAGVELTLSTVSSYGRILAEAEGLICRDGILDQEGLVNWLTENQGTMLIDGTHPYATAASLAALAAAEEAGVTYIRLERAEKPIPNTPLIHSVVSTVEAAEKAFSLGKSVLLTTGSRTLKVFTGRKPEDCRLIARILPEVDGVGEARELGFLPRDIIAMEGPFSQEMNEALARHVGADVMVMKNSGDAGGTFEKLAACEALGIAAVVIDRPQIQFPKVVETKEELLALVQNK